MSPCGGGLQAYPSLKPLASWTRDLCQRMEQFACWATTAHPPVLFWLSGFTFPTGFLTAVLQASARNNKVTRTHKGTHARAVPYGQQLLSRCGSFPVPISICNGYIHRSVVKVSVVKVNPLFQLEFEHCMR